ncbi:hypothetical protein M5K25_008542 [Dendrobium thyrsiflorum]|uniref:Uncharacterized protein n=1 Tax=Dendrobium thyrsiflorum TaxID=117978 RepID=A0ABD0V9S0_DENTH
MHRSLLCYNIRPDTEPHVVLGSLTHQKLGNEEGQNQRGKTPARTLSGSGTTTGGTTGSSLDVVGVPTSITWGATPKAVNCAVIVAMALAISAICACNCNTVASVSTERGGPPCVEVEVGRNVLPGLRRSQERLQHRGCGLLWGDVAPAVKGPLAAGQAPAEPQKQPSPELLPQMQLNEVSCSCSFWLFSRGQNPMEEQMRLYIRLAMEDSGFHLHTSMDNNIYNLINVTRFPSFDTSARMRLKKGLTSYKDHNNTRLIRKRKWKKKIISYRIRERKMERSIATTFVSHRGRETYYTGGYDPVVPPVAPPPDWLGATDALIQLSVLLRQSLVLKSGLCSPQVPRKRKEKQGSEMTKEVSAEAREANRFDDYAAKAASGPSGGRLQRRIASDGSKEDRLANKKGFGMQRLEQEGERYFASPACEQLTGKQESGREVSVRVRNLWPLVVRAGRRRGRKASPGTGKRKTRGRRCLGVCGRLVGAEFGGDAREGFSGVPPYANPEQNKRKALESDRESSFLLLPPEAGREPLLLAEVDTFKAFKEQGRRPEKTNRTLAWSNLYEPLTNSPSQAPFSLSQALPLILSAQKQSLESERILGSRVDPKTSPDPAPHPHRSDYLDSTRRRGSILDKERIMQKYLSLGLPSTDELAASVIKMGLEEEESTLVGELKFGIGVITGASRVKEVEGGVNENVARNKGSCQAIVKVLWKRKKPFGVLRRRYGIRVSGRGIHLNTDPSEIKMVFF